MLDNMLTGCHTLASMLAQAFNACKKVCECVSVHYMCVCELTYPGCVPASQAVHAGTGFNAHVGDSREGKRGVLRSKLID